MKSINVQLRLLHYSLINLSMMYKLGKADTTLMFPDFCED